MPTPEVIFYQDTFMPLPTYVVKLEIDADAWRMPPDAFKRALRAECAEIERCALAAYEEVQRELSLAAEADQQP